MPEYPTETIDRLFNTDATFTPEMTIAAGLGVAQLIRYLNYATGPGQRPQGTPSPEVIYSLLGSLGQALDQLAQTIEQIKTTVLAQGSAPGAGLDGRAGTDRYPTLPTPAQTAGAAAGALNMAKLGLPRIRSELMTAQVYAGRIIGAPTTGADE